MLCRALSPALLRSVDQARVAYAASAQVQAASAGAAGAAPRFVGTPVTPEAQALADGMVSLLTLNGMAEALRKTPVPTEFKVRLGAPPPGTGGGKGGGGGGWRG